MTAAPPSLAGLGLGMRGLSKAAPATFERHRLDRRADAAAALAGQRP